MRTWSSVESSWQFSDFASDLGHNLSFVHLEVCILLRVELQVFIQGPLLVGFSLGCSQSSIKGPYIDARGDSGDGY